VTSDASVECLPRGGDRLSGSAPTSVGGDGRGGSISAPATASSSLSGSLGLTSSGNVARLGGLVLVVSHIVLELSLTVLGLEVLEEVRDLLLGLEKDVDKSRGDVLVALVVERSSMTLVADTTSTSDAVDVLRDAAILHSGQVVVDDVVDLRDIDTAAKDVGGDEDMGLIALETTHSVLTLKLGTAAVHENGGELTVVEVIVDFLHTRLAVAENESAAGRSSHQEIVESLLLRMALNEHNVLGDVLVSRAGATDADTHEVGVHVGASDGARLLGEGGREHEVGVIGVLVHVYQSISEGKKQKEEIETYRHHP